MAQTALGSYLLYPEFGAYYETATIGSTIDNANDFCGAVFISPVTGTLDKIHYRTGTNTALNATLQVRIVDVSTTTGGPGTTTNGSAYTTTTFASNTNYATTSLNASLTAGTLYAVRLDLTSYTSGSCAFIYAIRTTHNASGTHNTQFPYVVQSTDNAGTLVKNPFNGSFGLEFSGGVYYQVPGVLPVMSGAGLVTYNNASGSTTYGNVIVPPVPMDVIGLWACGDLDGACTFDLYSGTNTSPIASRTCTHDPDVRGSVNTGIFAYLFDSGGTESLTASSTYRIGVTATSATNISLSRISTVPSQAQFDQMSAGQNCIYTERGAGAWSNTTTARAACGVIVSKFSDGAGTGGGSANLLRGKL